MIAKNDQSIYLLTIHGQVQGVGFRPFIKRLAEYFGLTGYVRNQGGVVEIVLHTTLQQCQIFIETMKTQAPPRAKIQEVFIEAMTSQEILNDFRILKSKNDKIIFSAITPDFFCCEDCLKELNDPTTLYFRYPFISCTQCGPRYTVQKALPYDRERTTLSAFPLCEACLETYQAIDNRRFHAETTACPRCGPTITFQQDHHIVSKEDAFNATIDSLHAGSIVAIQGIGGYHLCCLATNSQSIDRLRQKKRRPDKPLAVLFKDLRQAEQYLHLSAVETQWLNDISRPIVLAQLRSQHDLAFNVAPGLTRLGAFLPYSPLQTLILQSLNQPLVATSGNLSGQPVFFDTEKAKIGLQNLAEGFLSHNRLILRPADDSVLQVIDEKAAFIRLGRGLTPKVLPLPYPLPTPTFACGSVLKAAPALALGQEAVLFPHLGDMEDLAAQQLLQKLSQELPNLYGQTAHVFLSDAHPDYPLRPWLEKQNQWQVIFHHHAHASALAAEAPNFKHWLMLTWDGLGFGEADPEACQLWGGEFFIGKPGNWKRVASILPLKLLGEAGRDPWRSAAAVYWQSGGQGFPGYIPEIKEIFYKAWQQGINCHDSSAMGRLFDAMACLLGLRHSASYEGQAAMELEAFAEKSLLYHKFLEKPEVYFIEKLAWPRSWQKSSTLLRLDWRSWWPFSGQGADLAFIFHCTLALAVRDIIQVQQQKNPVDALGVSGGVWQNKLLCQLVKEIALEQGLPFFIPRKTPANDGQIAYGQLVEWSAKQALAHPNTHTY